MNVLIACEESQAVCKAFRERGHRAFSCDIQECSGGHPEWHIQGDVLPLINGNCTFQTADTHTHTQQGQWDLLIAHPPCTHLAVSGARWFTEGRKDWRLQDEGAEFFMKFINAKCEHIAVENPICVMSTRYRKPDQIIQPWMFGHKVSKSTCLWLKNLPKLKPTNIVEPEIIHSNGKAGGFSGNSLYATDDEGRILRWNDPRTAKARSKTFEGIANAMAEQWAGKYQVQMQFDL